MFFKRRGGGGAASAGKEALKFRFEVSVDRLDSLPAAVRRCRVVWSRGSKVQMTEVVDAGGGVARFGQQRLAVVATLYRDASTGAFAPKVRFVLSLGLASGCGLLG